MKQVINGRVYNTETAEEIADYSNGYEEKIEVLSLARLLQY